MKKTLLSLWTVLFLIPTFFILPLTQNAPSTTPGTTKSQTYQASISPTSFAFLDGKYVATSDKIPAAFAFDGIVPAWNLPNGAEVCVRYYKDLSVSECNKVELDGADFKSTDEKNPMSDIIYAPEATAFDYQITLSPGAYAQLDSANSISLNYLRSETVNQVADQFNDGVVLADGIKIQPRSAWAPDENLRTIDGWLAARKDYCDKSGCSAALPTKRTAAEVMSDTMDKYPEEAKVIRETDKEGGKDLFWPLEYTSKIKKIVVHHTAETFEDAIRSSSQFTAEEYQSHIRSIYYYHDIIREWGDIGYNYIIDPLGNIYQGRAGDDGVVGAHAAGYNPGSIGISMMGNFENIQPPDAQLKSLEYLVGYLSAKHNLDPNGRTTFYGDTTNTILGHRDLGKTACPGKNLYEQLGTIRSAAKDAAVNSVSSEAEVVGGLQPFNAKIAEKVHVVLQIKNDSDQVWTKNKIQLTSFKKRSRSLLYDSTSWSSILRPGTIKEDSVSPGGIATWEFNIVGRKIGMIEEVFKVNLLGKGWLKMDPINIQLNVQSRNGQPISTPRITVQPTPTVTMNTATPVPTSTPSATPAAIATATPGVLAAAVNPVSPTNANPEIRIKLGGYVNADNTATFITDRRGRITTDKGTLVVVSNTKIVITKTGDNQLTATSGSDSLTGSFVQFVAGDGGIVTVDSWDAWNSSHTAKYNEFRGAVRSILEDGHLVLVNYIRLEDYLAGLAESSNTQPTEMQKLMSVLTRTYALYYSDPSNRKFPGHDYDGSASPAEFQYYLGYGFEKLAPTWAQSVKDTAGLVVKYNGKVVKTPYFSASDGTKTKSSMDVWGWSAPYLVPVDDSMCAEKAFRGHGVGLSACGARQQIKDGKKYEDVIKYYYQGVTIEQAV